MQRSEKATINTQPNKTQTANKKAKTNQKNNPKSEKTPSHHNHKKRKTLKEKKLTANKTQYQSTK